MSRGRTQQSSGGIGFLSLLFLVFLVLKLTGVITWSWWLVTLPLWGPLALSVLVLLVIGVVALVGYGAYKLGRRGD